jgi:hypothetical protein
VKDDALNIARDYLDRTGHATSFKKAQSTAARESLSRGSLAFSIELKLLTSQLGQCNRTNLLGGVSRRHSQQMAVQLFGPKKDFSWCMRLQSNA